MDRDRARVSPSQRAAAPLGGRLIGDTLHALDELDRQIAVALQQDGRASWRAIAETVGSSTATVARRGQHLLSSGVLKVTAVPALGSKGQVDSFLTIVTGRYDIIAELVVLGGATHYPG